MNTSAIQCGQCGGSIQLRQEMAGQLVSCPYCSSQFVMPMPSFSNQPVSKVSSRKKPNPLPMLIGLGIVAVVAVIGLIVALIIASGGDDIADSESAPLGELESGRSKHPLSNLPLSGIGGPFSQSKDTTSDAARQKMKTMFENVHRNDEISNVKWHPPKRHLTVFCTYQDSDGQETMLAFNAYSDDELETEVDKLKSAQSNVKLEKVTQIGAKYTVTYLIHRETGNRYGRDRFVVSRPHTQINDQVEFHGPEQIRQSGHTNGPNPLDVDQ